MNMRLVHLFRIVGMILHQLRILYLLEIEGGITQWVIITQALYFRGVSMEEFLNDIFKSKSRCSCTPL